MSIQFATPDLTFQAPRARLTPEQLIIVTVLEGLSRGARRVLSRIICRFYRKGECHATNEQIAASLGLTKATIQPWMDELERLGLLVVIRIGDPRNPYTANLKLLADGVRDAFHVLRVEKPAKFQRKMPINRTKTTSDLRPSVPVISPKSNSNRGQTSVPTRHRQVTENALLSQVIRITNEVPSLTDYVVSDSESKSAHTPAMPELPPLTAPVTPAKKRWEADLAPFLAKQQTLSSRMTPVVPTDDTAAVPNVPAPVASIADEATAAPISESAAPQQSIPLAVSQLTDPGVVAQDTAASQQHPYPVAAAAMVTMLIAIGMHPVVAEQLAGLWPDRIEPSLRLLSQRIGIRDRAAWLVNAIRRNYAISVPKPGSEYERVFRQEQEQGIRRALPEHEALAASARRKRETEEAAARAAHEARFESLRGTPEFEAARQRARERVFALGASP